MAKGALYLSSGPSGAGKDTLLMGAQDQLKDAEEVRFDNNAVLPMFDHHHLVTRR